MTTDASSSVDHVVTPGDPLCALLAATSPNDSLALLPPAVRRAAELSENLRNAVQMRSGATDPLLVELASAMESAAVAHERFVSTWSDTTVLSGFTQSILEADVCTLTGTWASVIKVVVDSDATA